MPHDRHIGLEVYGATKAALRNFARSWTRNTKEHDFRVNVLSPGPTLTPRASRARARGPAGGIGQQLRRRRAGRTHRRPGRSKSRSSSQDTARCHRGFAMPSTFVTHYPPDFGECYGNPCAAASSVRSSFPLAVLGSSSTRDSESMSR
ncbi:SDR family oxidoreductase [Nocardia lijiangensis]|uniref:SDR family oxidoreductase n=1 Tax=Nocardia lijiangensis TaxID=299618 RepID=UPI001C3FE9F5|nr:SDR family oxidoreductase [Nocardia lijiangensis]